MSLVPTELPSLKPSPPGSLAHILKDTIQREEEAKVQQRRKLKEKEQPTDVQLPGLFLIGNLVRKRAQDKKAVEEQKRRSSEEEEQRYAWQISRKMFPDLETVDDEDF